MFEREANRISENLNKPVPPTPGVKTQSPPMVGSAASTQPYIIGQGPSQDLLQGLGNAPLNLDLRFEDAEIREVATTVLGDILKKPYVIDTTLRGRVSLRIGRNVSQRGLMEALRQSVNRVGGDIRLAAGTYEINNATAGALDNQKIAQLRAANASVSIVPLRFAKPSVVSDLLKAIYPAAQMTVDEAHSLLILAGSQQQRDQMQATAESLDVDGMSNKTVAVYPIGNGNATAVAEDLRKIYASGGGGQSPVEFIPLARSNSVMAIARQPSALTRVGELIRGLDQRQSSSGRRMYVLQLQHARATALAQVLRESLGLPQPGSGGSNTPPTVTVTPMPQAAPQASAGTTPASLTGAVPPGAGGESGGSTSNPWELDNIPLRIVANPDTNSLVVFATPGEFGLIQDAVRRLDGVPLQVLIEATIMDVTLNDALQFGVQAFLQQQTSAGNTIQAGVTAAAGFAGLVPQSSGFNFIFATPGQVQAAINALRSVTTVTVLSSPQVVTLDNQPAKLEVGSQVPITTQQVTNTTTSSPAIVNSIQYVQTGVILHVTPRVNSTGGVDLDISQEVTDTPAGLSTVTPSLTPVLNRRIIETRISVQSTQTVALGGLITESASDGRARIPLLGDLPVVGWLFGQTNVSKQRRELLVFLTPTVFTSPEEARNFSLELRRRIDTIWKKEGSPRRSP